MWSAEYRRQEGYCVEVTYHKAGLPFFRDLRLHWYSYTCQWWSQRVSGCTEWVKSDNTLFLVNSWIRKLGSIGMRWWWWVHHIPLGGMTVASVDTSCPRTARVCPFHIRPHKEKTIFQSNDYFVYMLLWWVVRLLFACILVGVRQQLGPN